MTRLVPVLVAAAAVAVAAPAAAVVPGGSNYNWFHVAGCDREPYGTVASFHTPAAKAAIPDQLARMIRSGQRRLRIGIYHQRDHGSGTVMSSTGGDLSPQHRQNLADLLAAAKRAGFVEIELALHPPARTGRTAGASGTKGSTRRTGS